MPKTNKSDTKELFAWLRSLWGALAATAVVFPTAAALLKVPLAVERSQVSSFYPILGSLTAAFAVLLVAALAKLFKSKKVTMIATLFLALISFGAFFGFLYVRVYYLDRQTSSINTHYGTFGDYSTTQKDKGIISVEEFRKGESKPWKVERYGDPADIAGLAGFTLAFGSFAALFSVLGVHLREEDRSQYSVTASQNNDGEQDGSGQPATRSESKSEGSDKPQPEAEGRSR